jgi:phytoene dehydrogenase-like protein
VNGLTSSPSSTAPVVVVGGGLTGMATAARLAKSGYPVELHERSDRLGGRWAASELSSGVLVDAAPAVLGFPAPWRDLFRKSGRPLEAELARQGYALEPAEPAVVIFADGSELVWPADRGGQQVALTAVYGAAVAERWRDLVDRLGQVWQTLRPLGWEADRRDADVTSAVRRDLGGRQNLADLARSAGHPHLEALVRSVGHRLGGSPEDIPAWAAVELSLQRTFGRWQVQPTGEGVGPVGTPGRTSVLVEALGGRLDLRRVDVHLNSTVTAIRLGNGRVTAVGTGSADRPAQAVVSTVDPWYTFGTLLPGRTAGRTSRRIRRLRPALAPAVRHAVTGQPSAGVRETVTLTADGVPTVTYTRPVAESTVISTHDFGAARPCPASGVAWAGMRSWIRRPAVTTEVPGLFVAGPFSPAGPGGSAEVLSGALAAYAVQDHLGQRRATSV